MMKAIFVCVLTVLVLTGCATNPSTNNPPCADHYAKAIDNSLSGQANQFAGDLYDCQTRERMKTIATSALMGAAVGAGLGAIIGAATGLGAKSGAAIGAGVGGLGGAGYGVLAANRNDAADKVSISDQAFAILQKENLSLANYIAQANQTIAEDEKKLVAIKSNLRQHKISRAKAEQAAQKLNETKSVLLGAVANLKKRRDQAAQSIPKDNPQFGAEMKHYDEQIAQLERIAVQTPERRIEGS
jgi:hypothetical protein